MATPVTPADYEALIPAPTSPLCQKLFRDVLQRGAELDYAQTAYLFSEDGTQLGEGFKTDLCSLNCAGTGTGGTGPGDPNISVPQGVSATDGTYPDKVVVTWTLVSGATGYEIWRGTTNSSASASRIGTVTGQSTLTFTDDSADPGVTYFYFVRTVTATGVSMFSTPDPGYAAGTFAGQVIDLEASQGITLPLAPAIYLAFTAVPGAQGYTFWRSTTNDFATATVLDANRQPFDNSQAPIPAPPGEHPLKPYFTDGFDYLLYADASLSSTARYTKHYYWVQPLQMSAGQVTAVGSISTVAVGWAVGDGVTDSLQSIGDSLRQARLSIPVPGGRTRAWIAVFAVGGCGAGGSEVAGGGGGGGSGMATGNLTVVPGDILSLSFTPNADPTRAAPTVNGANGVQVDVKLNGVAVVTIAGGSGGSYDVGGAGAGGAGGVVSLVNLTDGVAFDGRDGLPAEISGLKGGRGGALHFGIRSPSAHFGTSGSSYSWPGDGIQGAGGSRALPSDFASATGGVTVRGAVAVVIFYTV